MSGKGKAGTRSSCVCQTVVSIPGSPIWALTSHWLSGRVILPLPLWPSPATLDFELRKEALIDMGALVPTGV